MSAIETSREANLKAHIAQLAEAGRQRNEMLKAAEARAQQAERDARNIAMELARLKRENKKLTAQLLSVGARP